jgi:hypothetical protein
VHERQWIAFRIPEAAGMVINHAVALLKTLR